jgi:ribosomal-protein-alanine N-acetyltransferase
MQIRDLLLSDTDNLLEFELANRDWFEKFVASRGDYFYSTTAVQDHIRAYRLAKQQGRFHGCVIVNEHGKIVGRANLREMDLKKGVAEVGYRIGQCYTGQGIATAATQHLIALAYGEWHIRQLSGFVSVENPASAKVLEKNGFVKIGIRKKLSVVKDGEFDCIEYRHVPSVK